MADAPMSIRLDRSLMQPPRVSADWVLAVLRSRTDATHTPASKRATPVDGPFAETKEWMGCGTSALE